MNPAEQEYCLRWNNHENNLCSILESMLKRGVLVDVTLSCEGKSLRLHRAILSACSPYFENLFSETEHPHPIIILKDVKSEELQSLVDYMYTGQVTVSQSNLDSFLKMAESLKIRGLVNHGGKPQHREELQPVVPNPDSCIPLRKRRRKLSAEFGQATFQPGAGSSELCRPIDDSASNLPTDLSLPKLESGTLFQPVIHAVSYSSVDPCNSNQPNKIYLKPKEALISPPLSEMDESSPGRSSNSNDQIPYMARLSGNGDTYNRNTNEHEPFNQRREFGDRSDEPSTSRGISLSAMSDDEDIDAYNQESEVGAPMVRSGVCTVCGCFRSDLRQHMDSHSGQSFQCHICGRTYPRRKTLNQHIKRSHPGLIPDNNGVPIQ